jgi:hypothetical protein
MLPFSGRGFVVCVAYNPRRCHWAKIYRACSAPIEWFRQTFVFLFLHFFCSKCYEIWVSH